MNKKLVFQFLLLTFSLTLFLWGLLAVLGRFGFTMNSHSWLYVPYILGGLSPAISSYIVLKKNNGVAGFREWIKNLFTVKIPVKFYGLVILFYSMMLVMFVLIPPGLEKMEPVYVFFVSLPVMLIGGGLEEAGWRYILQPELDKKFGFILSSVMVAPIWAVWHLPLFFIQGVGQYGTNFLIFSTGIAGLTFVLGAIRKITGSVFLCVLFHSMVNAGYGTFIVTQTPVKNIITAVSITIVSIIAVFLLKASKPLAGFSPPTCQA
jgi:membrane protease YdiL (CAAX protease family)